MLNNNCNSMSAAKKPRNSQKNTTKIIPRFVIKKNKRSFILESKSSVREKIEKYFQMGFYEKTKYIGCTALSLLLPFVSFSLTSRIWFFLKEPKSLMDQMVVYLIYKIIFWI
jgi:hypothetical protein